MADPIVPLPTRVNPLLRLGIAISDRVTGRRLAPPRLLAWYPRAAVGAGVLEALVAHDEPSARLLKLVRITASLTTQCPFCVDMNSFAAHEAGVTDAEVTGLQRWLGDLDADPPATLDAREQAAVAYARALSSTPVAVDEDLRDAMTSNFTERDIVIVVTTTAQVNFWARTIQGLGIQPEGFCTVPPGRAATPPARATPPG